MKSRRSVNSAVSPQTLNPKEVCMTKLLRFTFLFRSLAVSCLCVPAQSAAPLTNKDVIDLVKMGMSSDVIVAKIKNSSSNLDTSLAALQELKTTNVPETVILAMVNAGNGSATATDKPKSTVMLLLAELTRILQIIIWPAVAIVALLVVRPHLSALLSKSTVKLTMFGQSIETTLPELEDVIQEQADGQLTEKHIHFLESLSELGVKDYPNGIASEDRKFLRPIRNSGLILATPRNAFLSEARGLRLSALGRLYLKARRSAITKGASFRQK